VIHNNSIGCIYHPGVIEKFPQEEMVATDFFNAI
jgi:hypothetical protein